MGEKIKIGVFGAYRGMAMINVLADHPEASLVAVCDKFEPALKKVKKVADEHNIDVALYTHFDEFEKHDMDAVVLANYANEHAIYAVRLLKGGKHVLSEVLPCETMAQAVELIEAVEQSGKVYAYAENYCYMAHSFEMRRRYERGDIGDVMYAEGEYIHDCASIWPDITYGEPEHWRNNMYPTFYCTHSMGPMMTITGRRPVRVSAFVTPNNDQTPGYGAKGGSCGAIEMVTMDNGAIMRSVHGGLKREPSSSTYRVYGTKGCLETDMFPQRDDDKEWERKVMAYREGEEICKGTVEHIVPDLSTFAENFQSGRGHGGSDFFATHFFIQKILGREAGMHYSIDVYTAVDMGIVGILGYRSVLDGGKPYDIPNLRNPEERDAWRNDNKCTNPKIASGDDLLPCFPFGTLEIDPEEYARVREMWLAKRRDDE